MIRALIVEDDAQVAARVKEFLLAWAKGVDESIKVSRYADAENFLEKYVPEYDVIFLDIELKGMDGMTAARKLRKIDKEVMIIFVTNLAQYAVDGYSVDAFDFIVKPVRYANFKLKLNRMKEALKNRRGGKIVIAQRSGKRAIQVNDVKYVEINRHVLTFHMVGELQQCSGTLKYVQELLKDYPFVLCNQSYLVNLNYVDAVDGNVVEVADEKLVISKPKRKEFLQAVAVFMGQGGGVK